MPGTFYPLCLGTIHYVLDDGSAPTVRFLDFIPKTARVVNNGYHLPDTFEATVDAKYFPFSPEIIRTAAVELYFVQTPGLITDENALSDLKNTGQFQGQLRAKMQSGPSRFSGIVRQADVEAGPNGRVFRMQGEDYTYLLASKPWPDAKRHPHGPLKDVIQALCDEAATANQTLAGQTGATGLFNVVMVGWDGTPQVVDSPNENLGNGKTAPQRPKAPARGKKVAPRSAAGQIHTNSKGFVLGQTGNYWDAITRIVQSVGGVVYVRGKDVIIASTDALYDAATLSNRLRRVSYGRDVRELKVQRQMGLQSVPQIKVVSYDPVQLMAISAVYPPDSVVKSAKGQKLLAVDGYLYDWNQQKTYVARGVRDPSVLLDQAKNLYGHLGRHEAKVTFSTRDLLDLDGSDMLQLWAGDPVMIDVDDRPKEDIRSKKRAQAIAATLKNLGWPSDLSYSVGFAVESLEWPTFYTTTVTLNWDQQQGLDIESEAKNYFRTYRDDVSANQGG